MVALAFFILHSVDFFSQIRSGFYTLANSVFRITDFMLTPFLRVPAFLVKDGDQKACGVFFVFCSNFIIHLRKHIFHFVWSDLVAAETTTCGTGGFEAIIILVLASLLLVVGTVIAPSVLVDEQHV